MRGRILKESIDLFDKKGFSKTSIQDIIDTIGVTKGTFYYYFKSKQELLMDIHLNYIKELLAEQEVIFNDEYLSNKEKMNNLISLIIKNIKIHGKSARVFNREFRHLDDNQLKLINDYRKEFRIKLQKLLGEGIEKGEFRDDLRCDIVIFGILGMVNRSYNWYDPDGEVSEEELVNTYMDIILNGIKKEEKTAHINEKIIENHFTG
ncbi:HTH-type transcriptional repressor KstR2 [Solibacillus isronensis B3W22]|uniref:HTH-type transcriptional repressor KstR2 n=1 Tax=Solibacillus isronensis B3W22 TaxID=1224748 RepID=K1L301_9BACL|nr:TetR/AcrR family transcriptional regulator [Solibacillus isronensis]AMO85828.1 TetR family transcriptional regulator [Solibacillus silvestris]EKB46487.1 HTH-type transcriptional repressor KstR2 [Solibacillus isronensis B3W22]